MYRAIFSVVLAASVLTCGTVAEAETFTGYADAVRDQLAAAQQDPSLTPRQHRAVRRGLAALDRTADDVADDLRNLKRLARHLRSLEGVLDPGSSVAALVAFRDHIAGKADRLRAFLGPRDLSPQRAFAKAFRAMDRLDRRLDGVLDVATLCGRVRGLIRSEAQARRVERALRTRHRRLRGLPCDSIGPAGTPFVRGVNCRMMLVDGYPRRYIVYVPTGGPFQASRPVVFMFHGSAQTGQKFLRDSGWREVADSEGAYVVFPTALRYRILKGGGLATKWHYYRLSVEVDVDERTDNYPEASDWPADDIKFTTAMLDDLDALLEVDPAGVFASGFSNGGSFTKRVAFDLPHRFSALTTVGSDLGIYVEAPDPDPHPNMWAMLAENDPRLLEQLNAPAGEPPPPKPRVTAIPIAPDEFLAIDRYQADVERVTEKLGLEPDPTESAEFETSSLIRWAMSLPGNGDGNEFVVSVLGGLRHKYPNGENGFYAAQMSWEFFERHWVR